jgi:hypothetical protein
MLWANGKSNFGGWKMTTAKRPDPYLSDIACQRRAQAAGECATEVEIPKANHFTKSERAIHDALWTYFEALETPFECPWGDDMGVIAEMDHDGWRISIKKRDGSKVTLFEIGY